MKTYTIAISDALVDVAVKFILKDKPVDKRFSFVLNARRMDQDAITERIDDKSSTVRDFMKEVVCGWSGQRLVMEPDGEPAEFSPESLNAMLNVPGVAGVCFAAYFEEGGAKEKN